MHKERLMIRIKKSRTHRDSRLKARLAARAKVKKAKALERCKAFATLEAKSISQIVDSMEYREMKGVICKEGDAAEELFVIVQGTCEVTIQGKHVATLTELAVFGEAAIFEENAKRNATVTGKIKVLAMPRSKWISLLNSGVLSPACVDAIKAVRDERSEMNRGL